MKLPQHSVSLMLVLTLSLCLCVATKEDVDFVDTEMAGDSDAPLKCDACEIVAGKFGDAFSELRDEEAASAAAVAGSSEAPPDEDIINAIESVCDDAWEGFGLQTHYGRDKLTRVDKKTGKRNEGEETLWARRLQDMCDELLAEVTNEKALYNMWASGTSLEDHLCRGEGTFAACSADDWGPWPGDDYDDYDDDAADFGGVHDEF